MINDNKKGQVAIFVIVAIVLVGLVVVFFVVRDNVSSDIPAEFRPVYALYAECLEQDARNGLDILGSQGGRIEFGETVSGSDFAPFSSHLNFLGISVPYWYYVTGNNLVRESVPTKTDMEEELGNYIAENVNDCDFTAFYEQGYYIELPEDVEADIRIEDTEVLVSVSSTVVVSKEDRSARKVTHEVFLDSKLGTFHDLAREIYSKQKQEAFLEEYAVDTLRLYAPVDGVSVQCAPEIWQAQEVVDDLHAGLEANIGALKLDGNYYTLDEQEDNYFVIDLNTDESVNFLYSQQWPSKVEVTPAEGELLVAEPVGNQEGLGVMGFCYVPYHFVYDVSFPVLIQVSDGFELFQFPVAVIIDNNVPRAIESDYTAFEQEVDVCAFQEGEVEVRTFDVNLNPVEAEIEYRCFDSVCSLGNTEIFGVDSVLNSDIPLCVNGELIANAEGYAEKKVRFSSNSESASDIILDREYEVEVELLVGGRAAGDSLGIVYFVKEDGSSESVVWPEKTSVILSEGSYSIESFVYGDSSISIPGTTKTQCVESARSGVLGLFGATQEECFDIEIPAVELDQALVGGGSSEEYILESQLRSGRMVVDVGSLPRPTSLEELQYNNEAFTDLGILVIFE